MSHRFRRMPETSEMDILQAEISRDQGLMTSGNSDHRTVIPNARSAIQRNATFVGSPADTGNQSFFMEGQVAINIAREGRVKALVKDVM